VYDHINCKYSNGYLTYQENTIYNRKIIRLEDRYRKIWYGENPQQKLGTQNLVEHVRLLNKFNPGYILDYDLNEKEMIIDYKIVPGFELDKINYDDELREKVYDYCLQHLLYTWPYAFLSWAPWNILIDGDSINLIDWDRFSYVSSNYTLENMINLLDNRFKTHFLGE